jgi:hypothetical protein
MTTHHDREILGCLVREAWVRWAQKQVNSKPSWLLPWEKLTEFDKEVDRQIGESVADWVLKRATPDARAVGLVRELETALQQIHSNRIQDDESPCDCGECSQCVARVALARIAEILPRT